MIWSSIHHIDLSTGLLIDRVDVVATPAVSACPPPDHRYKIRNVSLHFLCLVVHLLGGRDGFLGICGHFLYYPVHFLDRPVYL